MDKTQNVLTIMEEYEELYLQLKPMQDELQVLKDTIEMLVLQEGESVSHRRTKAMYKRGYSRTYWNGKALVGYAAAHPEINEFRTDREYGPSVSVSVKE